MSDIGSNGHGVGGSAGSTRDEHAAVHRKHSIMSSFKQSLTESLALACQCYLCTPLVDCDPRLDPDCSEAGKKLKFPQPDRAKSVEERLSLHPEEH